MKKVLLVPTILAIASAPTISLVGCGNGGDEPTKSVDFGISSRQTTSKTTATLSLDWQPSEDSITFSSLSATSASNKIVSYEFDIEQSRPQQINLRFENELTVNVDDIVLEFDYHDKTQKIIDHAVLNNIHVDKYVEPPEPESEIEWDFVQNGEYIPTEIKQDPQPLKQAEAINSYLVDTSINKRAFIEDVLCEENYIYDSLVLGCDVETYISKYKITNINPEKALVSITIHREVRYEVPTIGEEQYVKTDLSLVNIKYTSLYSATHSTDGSLINMWTFAPGHQKFKEDLDEFKQYMKTYSDWHIDGTISYPLSEIVLDYSFISSNIDGITLEQFSSLMEAYYGTTWSHYYSKNTIAPDKAFDENYEISLNISERDSYLGCQFDAEDFEPGKYSVSIIDKGTGAPIPHTSISCILDGKHKGIDTGFGGRAALGEIVKGSNLVLKILNWTTHENIKVSITKTE